ncbi:MAG TPA: IS66 family transposase [Acetobacteraceae bacterium]|nr:IS66 family transposase [Acetobacteraceae bacterium]
MTHGIDLSRLSHAEKDDLILSLVGQLEAALARIGDLERRLARFERPAKTPDNSSLPPSKGQKSDRPAGDKPPRKSRPGVGRTLHPNPDRVVDAKLSACPQCQAVFPEAAQTPQQVYERIELPPIKPDVTQVRLFGGRCACCGERVRAAAPVGLEPGSPFGQSIAALVVYLHYAHAIGMERLATLMAEIFSLSISEGAISNMLARAREPLLAAAATIRATVLASPVVCSDETSARVSGKNWWEWVFIGTLAVLHVIQPSRGKAVVQALFGEIRPMVWVSDMLGSQRGHAVEWQVCLAHLLRDATYAIECGDTAFSAAFKRLLLRAIAIGRRRDGLKDVTLRQHLADLDRRLDRIMAAVPSGEPGRKLRKRIAANRAHLFVFVTNRQVPFTNNVSERHLRPSVIFRKVTNGFRCEWGAETYAAFRSIVGTAKANRGSVLAVLRFVLAAKLPVQTLPEAG